MAVEVQQEQLEPCRVALTIEVPPADVRKAMDTVFQQFAKRARVPGFRPGKAPHGIVKRYVDEGRVREVALERTLSNAYREALQKVGVTPYADGEPQLDLPEEQIDPEKGFSFKATVPLAPQVEMGDLEGLSTQRVVAAIRDEDVDAEIERFRQRLATYGPSEEGAEDGDRVKAAVTIEVEGLDTPDLDGSEPITLMVGGNLPDFDAGLRGIKAGEERTFQFTYPEETSDELRRGKTATVTAKAEEVQHRNVPEADEEFAKKLGTESLDDLKNMIRQGLEGQAQSLAEQNVTDSLIREVVRRATTHFPGEMVEAEVSDRLQHLMQALERRSQTLDDYLEQNSIDMTQLQSNLREQARETIQNTLVLLKLARENQITVTEQDVNAEIRHRAEHEGVKEAQMRRLLTETDELSAIRNRIFLEKIGNFLREKAEIKEVASE